MLRSPLVVNRAPRLSAVLLLLLAGGVGDSILKQITDKLSTERAGRTLGSGLIGVVAKYLVEVVLIQDINELKLSDLKEIAVDAWAEVNDGADLPRIQSKSIVAWLSSAPPQPVMKHTSQYAC